MSERRKSIHDGWTPQPQEQPQPGDPLYSSDEELPDGDPLRKAARRLLALEAERPAFDNEEIDKDPAWLDAWDTAIDSLRAALAAASSTPEPGIDVEVLALAMVNKLPDILDWEMHTDDIAAEYARLASKDRPEPGIDVERHAEAIRAVFSGDNDHLTVGELRVRLASKDR